MIDAKGTVSESHDFLIGVEPGEKTSDFHHSTTAICLGWIHFFFCILIFAGNLQNPSEQLDVVEMLSSLSGKT